MQRHLNQLRWLSLITVWVLLILIPAISLYQTYLAAHAYDLLNTSQQLLYDSMEWLTAPFTDHPAQDLDIIKGNTWSGTIHGWQFSDPLAVLGQVAASLHIESWHIYWPFVLTALIPLALTLIFGRFFCGWICPATLLYELNSNVAVWLRQSGMPQADIKLDRRIKYILLGAGLIISAVMGAVIVALVYPPAIIGRELYNAIALGGFGSGTVFLMFTLLFDLLVSRRGFCRHLCPGGALYALLGRYRLVRIQRQVESCNDCAKCNAVCEFALDPMRDDFGQECNNCTACIAICPTQSLSFSLSAHDQPDQGVGHLSASLRHSK